MREGKIQKDSLLFHFDSHADGKSPIYFLPNNNKSFLPSKELMAEYVKKISINSFLVPAIKIGLTEMVFWIDPNCHGILFEPWELRPEKGYAKGVQMGMEYFASVFPSEIDPKKVITDIDLDYFDLIEEGSKREQKDLDIMRNVMRKSGVITLATSPTCMDQNRALILIKSLLA